MYIYIYKSETTSTYHSIVITLLSYVYISVYKSDDTPPWSKLLTIIYIIINTIHITVTHIKLVHVDYERRFL